MSASNTGSRTYLKNAVMTASPEQLQLMLLDGAIRWSSQGLDAIRAGDREAAHKALERAQRITLELGLGMNRDANPELVDQMRGVFNFCYRRLIDANMQQSEAAVTETLQILRHQRETWSLLLEKLRGGPTVESANAEPTVAAPPSASPPTRSTGAARFAAAHIAGPSPVGDDDARFVVEA